MWNPSLFDYVLWAIITGLGIFFWGYIDGTNRWVREHPYLTKKAWGGK